jgi:hypothetical protein
MRIEITFRSGAQITADVEEFSGSWSVIKGDLRSLKWTTPDDWTRKLHRIELSEVVGIVAVRGEVGQP